jgi:hypothetical protein
MANGSRSRKNSRGGGKSAGGWVFALILLSAIFTFYQIPSDPSVTGLWNTVVAKSKVVEVWAKDLAEDLSGIKIDGDASPLPGFPQPGDGSGGGTGGDGSGSVPPAASDVEGKLNALTVAEPQKVAYDRDEWNHWISAGRGCWTVREKVLADEAVPGSLKMLDGSGKATSDANVACEIQSGTWNDPYTSKTFTNPKDLDVDHLIPLKNAASTGGQAWDANRKEAYANDLGYANHLIAVDASANRSKSDKGPAAWKPSNQGYWCEYATSWVTVASNYQLTVSPADKAALVDMLKKC